MKCNADLLFFCLNGASIKMQKYFDEDKILDIKDFPISDMIVIFYDLTNYMTFDWGYIIFFINIHLGSIISNHFNFFSVKCINKKLNAD